MSEAAGAATGDTTRAGSQLRVALVWHDEVMADRVLATPAKVTLGTTKGSTFTVPDLGLPRRFAILRPARSGYVLTLGAKMTGHLCLGGDEISVEELIQKQGGDRAGGSAGEFHATAVSPGDWGVIELDGTREHNLFFQFVSEEPPLPPSSWRDAELLLPAIAFALILHTVFIATSFVLRSDHNDLIFPGRSDLMARYLVRRPPVPEPVAPQAKSEGPDKEDINSATKGEKGKAGGEGEKPIARDPLAEELPPSAPKVALLDDKARSTFSKIITHRAMDDKVARMLNRMGPRTPGSFSRGGGSGLGLGDGKDGTGTTRGADRGGPGGGGAADKLFVSQGKIDAGETRGRKVKGDGGARKEVAVVGTGNVTGDFASWSQEEIRKVVRSRQGLIRACYQSEVSRVRKLGGQIVVQFRIQGSGKVTSARIVPGQSTLRSPRVESCIKRQITRLSFPAKGAKSALVNVPFNFSQR